MKGLIRFVKELSHYRSAVLGLLIIALLLGISAYTMITLPYDQAIQLWRSGEEVWGDYPRNAMPEWMNWFNNNNLAPTIVVNSTSPGIKKDSQTVSKDMQTADFILPFEYNSNNFPDELNVFFTAKFQQKKPQATVKWKTPDGREIQLSDMTVSANERFAISIDQKLARKFNDVSPQIALFAKPGTTDKGQTPEVVKGKYQLIVEGLTFEPDSSLNGKLVVYGQTFGWAGTDHKRRDLLIALLWGTPIALAFGFLAAVGSTITTFAIAALGSWFGGWVDALIQRLTEINSVLPTLPILILIGTFYTRNIWTILGVVIALGVFSLSIKQYRSMFLQVKEMPYIEAAHTYGASNLRIVFSYMMPKIAPVLIPSFVTLIPSFVFLEASLSVLGLGDPLLPTWGKIMNDAYTNGALYKGLYYWVIEPAVLLMLTGLGFAVVGFALDRIFNPRLREM
jgi:peptide/nickel transport system permease protein